MSKTDKTRPFAVRLGDDLHATAAHDHRFGDCTLPVTPRDDDTGSACRWVFHYTGVRPCSCSWCRGSVWYRSTLRAQRHTVAAALAQTAGCYNAGSTVDVVDSVLDHRLRSIR